MIKIGKLTDYAINIMGHMIKEDTKASRSASYISEISGVPEPTVAKILKKLAQGGLVTSVRGAAGGYKVSRPASEIAILDIINILEGPISMVSCCDGKVVENCVARDKCMFNGKWNKVNSQLIAVFDNIKLQDMVDTSCKVEASSVVKSGNAIN